MAELEDIPWPCLSFAASCTYTVNAKDWEWLLAMGGVEGTASGFWF